MNSKALLTAFAIGAACTIITMAIVTRVPALKNIVFPAAPSDPGRPPVVV